MNQYECLLEPIGTGMFPEVEGYLLVIMEDGRKIANTHITTDQVKEAVYTGCVYLCIPESEDDTFQLMSDIQINKELANKAYSHIFKWDGFTIERLQNKSEVVVNT